MSTAIGSLALWPAAEKLCPAKIRRAQARKARGKLGEMEREPPQTCRWLWGEERRSETAGPRRAAAGRGSARRWRCYGGVWDGVSSSGASGNREEDVCALYLDQDRVEREVQQ